ncbi:hypothetical protein RRG08_013028 [Elysia crispata]|uniref:Uncharacterized protein n=1 Tax=Elysia crispata TaxID=231223 RepID=A0AAE1DQA1_9GAST|nr:hypothetical protein RRG08_013028 [Elysia crispata]
MAKTITVLGWANPNTGKMGKTVTGLVWVNLIILKVRETCFYAGMGHSGYGVGETDYRPSVDRSAYILAGRN